VLPVFLFTEPQLGGYGFSPLQISIFLGVAGLSQALWTLIAFPPLHKRFGTGGVLRGCGIAWPIMFLFCPICNMFLRLGWTAVFWTVAPISLILGSGVSLAFTASQLALNDIAPSSHSLGTLNGVALTLVCAIRAVAPALFASIFALGARSQFLYGHLFWLVLIPLSIAFPISMRWLPAKAEGKLKRESDTE